MNDIINVMVKQVAIIRWEWGIKEFPSIHTGTHIPINWHVNEQGDKVLFCQKGAAFIQRGWLLRRSRWLIQSANKQVKLPEKSVSWPSLKETKNNIRRFYEKDWTKCFSNIITNHLRSWLHADSYSGNLQWVPRVFISHMFLGDFDNACSVVHPLNGNRWII